MWATSIGSTFSHSPVPGERKSGIPDGTEIPAPVSATTEPASRTRPASALDAAVYRPRHFGWRLPRKAPMPSRASSLAKTPGEGGLLGLDALVEVGAWPRPP